MVGIIQVPSTYEPAYNPNYFVVSGSNVVSGNYKLMCRIQAPSGTIVAKLKTPTDPNYNTFATFDVGQILESYVTHTVDIGLDRVAKASHNIQDYLVEFGEEYGTTPAEYWDGVNVQPCFVINAALSPREFNAYDPDDYLARTSPEWKFLTKYKGTRKVFSTTKGFLYFLNDETHRVNSILVTPYDKNGTALATSSIEQPYNGSSLKERLLYVPAAPANLNLIPQSQLFSGTSGSVIPANCAYYTMQMVNNSLSALSEALRFDIVENCSKYPNYPIYFLGQFGNIEVWNFNRRSDKRHAIEKRDYKTALGRFTDQYGHYGYYDTDRQLTTYYTDVTDTTTLNTDNLSEAELTFLKECVQSPIVYSLENGELIPVKIIDSFFESKQKVNDKIFNCTIQIQYASNLELQRG